ncbi:hypothetical protein DP20_1226 [Shigella flexneri]|nr:hypothetical protein DP20_1226 [Shigella flexneri]
MTESSDYESVRSLSALMSVKIRITLLPLIVQVNACSIKHYPTTKTNSGR